MNYQNAYKQTSVATASPGRLLIMLFDGLLRFMNQGKTAILEGRIEEAHHALCKSQDIVVELRTSLNHEVAPELCDVLNDLYSYFYRVLVDANRSKDCTELEEILHQVKELRGAFAEAEKISSTERHTEAEG